MVTFRGKNNFKPRSQYRISVPLRSFKSSCENASFFYMGVHWSTGQDIKRKYSKVCVYKMQHLISFLFFQILYVPFPGVLYLHTQATPLAYVHIQAISLSFLSLSSSAPPLHFVLN